jgi:enamine deaminase RidA (YjgF/YER057c/UK114 family)
MSFADVVSSRIYLTDDTKFQDMNTAVSHLLPEHAAGARDGEGGLTNPDYLSRSRWSR